MLALAPGTAIAASAAPGAACTENAPTYDTRRVQCQFTSTGAARKFRFKANFSGGHDDTSARIEPSAGEEPLPCDAGSKTSLFAEDGDVSLWCIFSAPGAAGTTGVVSFTIRWSHAEYTSFDLLAE